MAEISLLLLIFLLQILDLILEKFKSSNKIVKYVKTIVLLWCITLLIFFMLYQELLTISTLGLVFNNSWKSLLVIVAIGIASIYLYLLIKQINNNPEFKSQVKLQFEDLRSIMPENKKEALVFVFLLSFSAGVCEEIIFRGYLYKSITTYYPSWVGVIVSSVMFGFWHFYLGIQHVIRTSILGSILCLLYIVTDSLLIPIMLHIFIDIYSGLRAYSALKPSQSKTKSLTSLTVN